MWPGYESEKPQEPKRVTDINSPEKMAIGAHTNSDVDASKYAQHHTLGISANQASPGDHNHDGKVSRKVDAFDIDRLSDYIVALISQNTAFFANLLRSQMLSGSTLNTSRATDAWRTQVMDALERLGAVDSTSA
jgi:hypothetical protein